MTILSDFVRKKLRPIEFEFITLPFEIMAVGRSKITTEIGLYLDVQLIVDRYTEIAGKIVNKMAPYHYAAISFQKDEKGRFRYFVGTCVTMFQCGSKRTMDAEEITVPGNVLCAHAAVWARNNADLTVQVGKARRLFYEEVLPACSYKQGNEVECIELYGPASRQNMPMLDLYFPFEVISGEKE